MQELATVLAVAQSCAVVGLDGYIVQVEVDVYQGLPAFNVVGLPDPAVQEARERVRAALRNSDCEFPLRRITINHWHQPLDRKSLPWEPPSPTVERSSRRGDLIAK